MQGLQIPTNLKKGLTALNDTLSDEALTHVVLQTTSLSLISRLVSLVTTDSRS